MINSADLVQVAERKVGGLRLTHNVNYNNEFEKMKKKAIRSVS